MSAQVEPESSAAVQHPTGKRGALPWVLLAVAWLVVTALDIEFGIGFFSSFSLFLILVQLLAVVAVGVGLVVGAAFDSWKMLKWASIVVGLLMVEFVVVTFLSDYQRTLTIAVGDRVVAALEAYRVANGEYPDALNQLVPEFLREVPRSRMGWGIRPFRYGRDCKPNEVGESFMLSFDRHTDLWTCYPSEAKLWIDRD